MTAHPRRCGADFITGMPLQGRKGSSPQVRGRLFALIAAYLVLGLIPAGAGQTSAEPAAASACPAHPRRCGADPRTDYLGGFFTGLIPAGAGQTSWEMVIRPFSTGSSPQVRGRRVAAVYMLAALGLIPAGAGQTRAVRAAHASSWAHPRRCGADFRGVRGRRCVCGSSPQVRGRLVACAAFGVVLGLIPAGAGQTNPVLSMRRCVRAHPRRCGADRPGNMKTPGEPGSSPQVRGRRAGGRDGAVGPGLIPAGAGQTAASGGCSCRGRAHPRRCGADLVDGAFRFGQFGLIPAGAGQTLRDQQRCTGLRASGDNSIEPS